MAAEKDAKPAAKRAQAKVTRRRAPAKKAEPTPAPAAKPEKPKAWYDRLPVSLDELATTFEAAHEEEPDDRVRASLSNVAVSLHALMAVQQASANQAAVEAENAAYAQAQAEAEAARAAAVEEA